MVHVGDCHCGKIQFKFESESDISPVRCNCYICDPFGRSHLIIPKPLMMLKTGWEEMQLYAFNPGVAKYYFCKTCGNKPFYIPRSNSDCYSISFRNIQRVTFGMVMIEDFDGQQWAANASRLAHLSDK